MDCSKRQWRMHMHIKVITMEDKIDEEDRSFEVGGIIYDLDKEY
jgi:hypothetical protein